MGIPNLLVPHRALLDGICQSGPNQNLSVESGVSAAAAASVWACLDLLCKICLDAINKDLVYSYQHSLEINCAKMFLWKCQSMMPSKLSRFLDVSGMC